MAVVHWPESLSVDVVEAEVSLPNIPSITFN